MSRPRPAEPLSSADHSAEIAGAQADVAVCPGPGEVRRIIVTVAGAASSYIEVYDGTVAGGVRIGHATGEAATDPPGQLANVEIGVWCKDSIHVKSVDSGGTIRYIIAGDFRA